MAAESPQSDGTDLAAVRGIFFESGELGVGEGLAAEGEEPEQGTGDFERMKRRRGIEGGDDKGCAEDHDGDRLHLEKPKHFRREVAGPVATKLEVASVFDRMVADDANG